MLVKTSEGLKDVSIQKPHSKEYNVTSENYIVPPGEEKFYHAILEVMKFDAESGERISKARIQKFGEKTFISGGVLDNLKKQGNTVVILHDPKEYVAKHAEEVQAKKEENAKAALEAKEKADAKKAESEKAQRQEEINAGVKAALEAMGITGPLKATEKTETVKSVNVQNASTGKTTEVKADEKQIKPASDADKK